MSARLPPVDDRPQDAIAAWAAQSAAGELVDLDWVDARVSADLPRFSRTAEGFHHIPYGKYLPPSLLEAAADAQARGEPTLLEGLQLVFARAEWWIEARRLLWAPDSPAPRVLEALVEAHGIGDELHQGDPARLQRLAAELPGWFPRRGEGRAAADLLRRALRDPPRERLLSGPDADQALRDEVFACRGAGWWAARGTSAPLSLRIQAGWLRFQPPAGPPVALRAEDALVAWTPGRPLHRGLARLLPVWSCRRVTVLRDAPPVSSSPGSAR